MKRTGSPEVVKLRWRVRILEDESEIARRLAGFESHGSERERIYRFIDLQRVDFAVRVLCRVCGVSRSAYYAWAARGDGPDDQLREEATLANQIYGIWRKSRRRYGAPRITEELRHQGLQVNEKRVARLMAEMGISGACGRKKIKTTWRDPNATPAADLVNRNFTADAPDELLVTDITCIPTGEGWLYLCSILDIWSRRLLGWSLAENMRTELCLDALSLAAMTRDRLRFTGTVLHSDHGSQYTSDDFTARCRAMGITQSMGTVGDSYDNALAESFWASLKKELIYESHFPTRAEARIAIFEWIMWYNNERLHSSLGYLSPVKFEESFEHEAAA